MVTYTITIQNKFCFGGRVHQMGRFYVKRPKTVLGSLLETTNN